MYNVYIYIDIPVVIMLETDLGSTKEIPLINNNRKGLRSAWKQFLVDIILPTYNLFTTYSFHKQLRLRPNLISIVQFLKK